MEPEKFVGLFPLEHRPQMGSLPASVMRSYRIVIDYAYDADLVYPRPRELAQGMEKYIVDRLGDQKEHQGPEEKE